MYKITTNYDEFKIINHKAIERDITGNTSGWAEIVKHSNKDLWCMYVDNSLLTYELDFITNEWLNTDIVEELPSDWAWHFNKKQRLIIPAKLALTDFSEYISYVKTNPNLGYHIDDNATAFIYFNGIREEDKPVLNFYAEKNLIKIEDNPVQTVTLIIE